jgi:hypothetical protein
MLLVQPLRYKSSKSNPLAVKATELSVQIIQFTIKSENKNSIAHVWSHFSVQRVNYFMDVLTRTNKLVVVYSWKLTSCVVIGGVALAVAVLPSKTCCQKRSQCGLHWTGNFVLIEYVVLASVFVKAWREAAVIQSWIISIKFSSRVY